LGKGNKQMAFSNKTVAEAFQRAGGKCECRRSACGHYIRCNKTIVWNQRGNDNAAGGWEAHHKVAVAAGGTDSLSNCEILCIKCHKNTGTYGK